MVTIGVDPHKQTHTAAAVDQLGVEVEHRTAPAWPVGNGQLLERACALDVKRVWAVEDVRNVSGSLERFLIDRGETVVRLPAQLMAGLAVAPARAASLIRSTRWRSRAPGCAKVWRTSRLPDWRALNARSASSPCIASGCWTCAPGSPTSCAGSCTTSGPLGDTRQGLHATQLADQNRLSPGAG